MRISDMVSEYILRMLEESDGDAQIQRNELAGTLGCVPSQINYVITSRFTPEQGYIVESRRGGGGYIRITRIKTDKNSYMMHIINSIGTQIDCCTVQVILQNMLYTGAISEQALNLMDRALSDKAYICVPVELRDCLRASVFKNMLLTQI